MAILILHESKNGYLPTVANYYSQIIEDIALFSINCRRKNTQKKVHGYSIAKPRKKVLVVAPCHRLPVSINPQRRSGLGSVFPRLLSHNELPGKLPTEAHTFSRIILSFGRIFPQYKIEISYSYSIFFYYCISIVQFYVNS